MLLSEYSLKRLRDDGEFDLYRAHAKQIELPYVLLLAPASNSAQPRDTQEDRPRILIEERAGLGLGRCGPWPFQSEACG